ncbi:hypothetical protein NM688_g6562 [Phlebia brevispora]|uniref:Uncharacterized protein n=1 Tax=Phlebia brevispora TaxID=194682 RepID=A0ACC1SEL0_9APHY|nr:hypothetical protein NM688_g6562 [Phlebia brevispora]
MLRRRHLSPPPSGVTLPATVTDNHPEVPALIPLYDFSQYQRAMRGQLPPPVGSSQQMRQSQTIPQMQGAAQQALAGVTQGMRAPSHTQSSTRTPAQEPRYRAGATRVPLSQLPPTLTDEQLTRLDRLTRDAIDERLRVLEGVSAAVYRCIEELTRIRSVLPPREAGVNATPTENPAVLNPELAPSTSAPSGSHSEEKSLPSQAASGSQTESSTESDAEDLSRVQATASTSQGTSTGTSGSNEREQPADVAD